VELLAWGIAPGIRLNHHSALKARFGVSIPDITLVEIDAVPAQQLVVFLLKRASAMMLLLRLDVLQYSVELTRTHWQRTIVSPPERAAIPSVKRFDPFRGRFLCVRLTELGKGSRRRRRNMNVDQITKAFLEQHTEHPQSARLLAEIAQRQVEWNGRNGQ